MSAAIKMYNNANLSQQLNLAPQLLSWLKILQASSLELSSIVEQELASNPALEIASPEASPLDDAQAEATLPTPMDEIQFDGSDVGERLGVLAELDEEWRHADEPQLATCQSLQENHDFMMDHLSAGTSLQAELEQAILFSDLSPAQADAARVIAGFINARGYLDAALEEVARAAGLDLPEAQLVLEKFQALAPAGIGARDLRECLVLQLKALDEDTELAELLVNNWLDHLAAGRAALVAEHLGLEPEAVHAAFKQIRGLNPEPGAEFRSAPVEYVEADLEIRFREGELHVELLNERLPSLQLSSYCKRLLDARKGSKADLDYISAKVREASFLIQGISQRQDTILKVARQIMRVQHGFLSSDDGALVPLTMNKVASMIGVHETTVSRAITNKYIRTDRGLFEMRSFFKVGYHCADGSSVTPERVKKQVMAYVASEEALSPLTDADISERFKKQGLKVARRTVAKYREELGLPSSKERLMKARRMAESNLAVAV